MSWSTASFFFFPVLQMHIQREKMRGGGDEKEKQPLYQQIAHAFLFQGMKGSTASLKVPTFKCAAWIHLAEWGVFTTFRETFTPNLGLSEHLLRGRWFNQSRQASTAAAYLQRSWLCPHIQFMNCCPLIQLWSWINPAHLLHSPPWAIRGF